MNYCVYALLDPDGTPFYIGKGYNTRPYAHRKIASLEAYDLPVYRHIHSLWRSNTDYLVEILLDDLSESDAFDLERTFISEIGLENLKNCTSGGEGGAGRVASQQQRDRQSAAMKGRKMSQAQKDLQSRIFTGRTLSDYHCQRISEGKTGKRLSAEHRQAISRAKLRGSKYDTNSVSV